MSFDPPGYRPDRDYPIDAGHAYPDNSRPFGSLGVIRALRVPGQQMYDEDWNNAHLWLGQYVGAYAHYWRIPNAPYYTPLISNYILDPNQNPAWAGSGFANSLYQARPVDDIPLQAWGGFKVAAVADRIIVGFSGSVWRGMCSWHWYNDVIEIAIFVSQVLRNRVIASYVVEEEFVIGKDGNGCRVRNWPTDAQQIEIHRNGALVGKCDVAETSSGATMLVDTTFAVGDILSLKAPDDVKVNGLLGLSVTLIGGLT